MKKNGDISNKVDVILHGVETIGSAERSCNKDEMRNSSLLSVRVDILAFFMISLVRTVLIRKWMPSWIAISSHAMVVVLAFPA